MYLNVFKSLLDDLYANYLSKPMEGQNNQAVVVNPKIIHQSGPDSLKQANERAFCTKQCSSERLYQGKMIYRQNHGLAHTSRSMFHAQPVISYFSLHGSADLKKAAKILNNSDGIKKIMLIAAFSSIARTSEIDFWVQPAAHLYYRKQAGEIFESYYRKALNGELCNDIKQLFNLFKDEDEFIRYRDALVAMGDDKNFDPVHIILNVCHKLDLYRCRTGNNAQSTIDKYIRKYSEGNYGKAFWILINQAVNIIQATGRSVHIDGIERKGKNDFLACNSSVDDCVKALQNISVQQKVPTELSADDNPLLKPFFFKSIRADANDYWEHGLYGEKRGYMYWVTPSPINCDPHPPNRLSPKKRFTVKMVKHHEGTHWKVVERRNAPPTHSTKEKERFSKFSSLSYARPLEGYQPKVFGWNRGSFECLVGIRMEEKDVLINRIMSRDIAAIMRPYDFNDKQKAEELLKKKLSNYSYCNSLNELVQSGLVYTYNEVLGRVKKISAIAIFSDNLQSRLLAQLRARQYEKRLKEQAKEFGESFEQSYTIPIVYYIPDDQKNHSVYNSKAQQDDLAAVKDGQFGQYDDAQKCGEYLERLEELKNEPSFIEKNKIQQVHILAALGDKEALKKHLNQYPNDVNLPDAQGKTPAHYAAQNDRVAILKLLKQKGGIAVLKAKSKRGTPFVAAIDKKNIKAIKYFLVEGIGKLNKFEQLIKFLDCFPENERIGLLKHYKSELLEGIKSIGSCSQLEKLYNLKPQDIKEFLYDDLVITWLKEALGPKLLQNNKLVQAQVNLHSILQKSKSQNPLQFLKNVFNGEWQNHLKIDLNEVFGKCKSDATLRFLSSTLGDKWPTFLKEVIADGRWIKSNSIQNGNDLKDFLNTIEAHNRLAFLKDILGGEWFKSGEIIRNTYDLWAVLKPLKLNDRLMFLKEIFDGKWFENKKIIRTTPDLNAVLQLLDPNDRVMFLKNILGGKWLKDKNVIQRASDLCAILQLLEPNHKAIFLKDVLGGMWFKDNTIIQTTSGLRDILQSLDPNDRVMFLKNILGGKWLINKKIIQYIYDLPVILKLLDPNGRAMFLKEILGDKSFKDNKIIQNISDLRTVLKLLDPNDRLMFLKDVLGGRWFKDNKIMQSITDLQIVSELLEPYDQLVFLKEMLGGKWLIDNKLIQNVNDLQSLLRLFKHDDHRLVFLRDVVGGKYIVDNKFIQNVNSLQSLLRLFKHDNHRLVVLKDVIGGKWFKDNKFIQNINELQNLLRLFKHDSHFLIILKDIIDSKYIGDNKLIQTKYDLTGLLSLFKRASDELAFLKNVLSDESLKSDLIKNVYDLNDFLGALKPGSQLLCLKDVLGGQWLLKNSIIKSARNLRNVLSALEPDDRLVFLKEVIGVKWLVDNKILSDILGTNILKLFNEEQRLQLLSDPLIIKSDLFNRKELFEEILAMFDQKNQIAFFGITNFFENKKFFLKNEFQESFNKAKICNFLSQLAQEKGYDYKVRYEKFIDPNETLLKNIKNILKKPISRFSAKFFIESPHEKYGKMLDEAFEQLSKDREKSSPAELKEILVDIYYCFNRCPCSEMLSNNEKSSHMSYPRAYETFMRRLACCYQMAIDNSEKQLDLDPNMRYQRK